MKMGIRFRRILPPGGCNKILHREDREPLIDVTHRRNVRGRGVGMEGENGSKCADLLGEKAKNED